ncbi:Glycerol-3-phosphatase [Klebsormidium nitens]|uniref:glycerol-1-phosphatase n=1 Tax=Klebsormidium nitens TaxID=105231 RepID=A0A1Y1HSN3_KLENI|nr:Glycerol-3-phosphatase [Klebsormidium nitens]|eukprot:GAQ81640.1 Glycerol-3-phosphatase [Klebsormidium nitens]
MSGRETNMEDEVPAADKAESFIMKSKQSEVGVKIAIAPVDSDGAVATAPVLGPGILHGAISGGVHNERRKITHILFDMDGLLLDTERFYTIVQVEILKRFGKTFDWALKSKMIGKPALDAAKIFIDETGLQDELAPEGFLEEREEMLAKLFPDANLLPGVDRMVRHLAAKRVPMAVATSSHRRHYELKTTRHKDFFKLFHHVITGDDPAVKKGKPAPDIFEAAASRFDPPAPAPEYVLVFEDAPSGVRAARAAEMSVVMVPDENLDASLHHGAHQVLKSLDEFQPHEWGLPPYDEEDGHVYESETSIP